MTYLGVKGEFQKVKKTWSLGGYFFIFSGFTTIFTLNSKFYNRQFTFGKLFLIFQRKKCLVKCLIHSTLLFWRRVWWHWKSKNNVPKMVSKLIIYICHISSIFYLFLYSLKWSTSKSKIWTVSCPIYLFRQCHILTYLKWASKGDCQIN